MRDEADHSGGDVVLAVLPLAMARAVESYARFSAREVDESAKEFLGFHGACKAALGHIAALKKLEALCGKTRAERSPDDIEAILRYTRETLLAVKVENDDTQDQL